MPISHNFWQRPHPRGQYRDATSLSLDRNHVEGLHALGCGGHTNDVLSPIEGRHVDNDALKANAIGDTEGGRKLLEMASVRPLAGKTYA